MDVLIEMVETHLIGTYASQAGCSYTETTAFWNQLSRVLRNVPLWQGIIFDRYSLSGHVGERGVEFERVYGGFEYGNRNTEGNEKYLITLSTTKMVGTRPKSISYSPEDTISEK